MPLFNLAARISIDGADAAKRALHDVREGAHAAAGAISSRLGSAVSSLGGHFADTAGKMTLFSAGLSAAVGGGAFMAAARIDSLTRGLASVSANTADLTGQLSRLREVAKLPGLGFEEAVQGSVALQSAGISARLSERSLMAFGNALASVGRGKADLDGVTLALSQIASKGKVSAEEINQINERVPQIRRAMQAAFGTSETEALGKMGIDATAFISGVVGQLERLPRVTGGIQNGIENLSDAIKEMLVPLGKGLADMFAGASGTAEGIIATFKRIGTQVGEVFSAIGSSGVLGEVLSTIEGRFSKMFGGGGSLQRGIAGFAGTVLSLLKNLPDTISEIGQYLTALFSVIWQNIKSISSFIWASVKSISEGISSFTGGAMGAVGGGGSKSTGVVQGGMGIGDILKNLTIFGWLPMLINGARSLGTASGSGKLTMPDVPGLLELPSIKDVLKKKNFSDPLKDADMFTARIMAAIKPYSEIPDGLNFGGGASGTGKKIENVFASWDKHLSEIESNTKDTATALDSRRTMGGGELSRMGVTAAERNDFLRPDPYTRSIGSSFHEAVRRAMRASAMQTTRRSGALYAR